MFSQPGCRPSESSNFPGPARVLNPGPVPIVSPSSEGPAHPTDFAEFMRRYQPMVFTTAARLLADDAEAEDVAQEVFLRAYDRFPDLSASPTAGGWLKTVATRLCLNHLGRRRRRWTLFSELGDPDDEEGPAFPDESAGADPIAGLENAERREAIERALIRLPDSQRVPLVLRHFEHLSYEEIADRLGVSLAKVKTDIHRARIALARAIGAGWRPEGSRLP